MKTMIILSGCSVYHERDCHHLKRTPRNKWESITTEEAENGITVPVHCGTVGSICGMSRRFWTALSKEGIWNIESFVMRCM